MEDKEGGGEENMYQLVVAFYSNKLDTGSERGQKGDRTLFNRGKCKGRNRKP